MHMKSRYPESPIDVSVIMEEMALRAVNDEVKVTDAGMLRQAIIAEYDATTLYEQMAASASDEKLKKLFLSVAQEEKVHIGEFEALLDTIDPEHKSSVEDGKAEALK